MRWGAEMRASAGVLVFLLAVGDQLAQAQTTEDLLHTPPKPSPTEFAVKLFCDAPPFVRQNVSEKISEGALASLLRGMRRAAAVAIIAYEMDQYCERLKPRQPTLDVSEDALKKLAEQKLNVGSSLTEFLSLQRYAKPDFHDDLRRAFEQRGLTR
jgi:hypothetical protein